LKSFKELVMFRFSPILSRLGYSIWFANFLGGVVGRVGGGGDGGERAETG
jgi:hypothetical protein